MKKKKLKKKVKKKRSSHGLAWSNQVDLQKKGEVRSQVSRVGHA